MKELNSSIDPRIRGVFQQVARRVLGRLNKVLAEEGLYNQETDQAQKPLTDEGRELLMKQSHLALGIAFSRAQVILPTEGWAVDKLHLANSVIEKMGTPQIRSYPTYNYLGVAFRGEEPIVRRVISPLNVDEAIQARPGQNEPTICKVHIGKRMIIGASKIIRYNDLDQKTH